MESQDIVQNLIDTLGQSQRRRFPPALAQNYIEIDERDDARLLAHLKRLAAHVRFYPEDGGAPGDWQDFFPFEADEVREWIDALGADTRPQLALLLAFFEVYRQPQALLNGLTARHLDFFYRDVLRLELSASSTAGGPASDQLPPQSSPSTKIATWRFCKSN